jgi:ketosteroid isomerase-like protein
MGYRSPTPCDHTVVDTDRCWELIEAARADANLDWDECDGEANSLDALLSEALVARLAQLPPREIAAFEVRFSRLQDRIAGHGGVHKADYLLTLGVGDDGFTDFCAGLVGLGRHWYDLVLADPDNLADHPAVRRIAAGTLDRFALLAERFQYAAHTAYEQVTGDEFPCEVDRPWETPEDDLAAAPQPVRLPRLEALFAQNNAILLDRFGEHDVDYSNTMAYEPRAVVIAFNDRINHRDIDGLTALMTDDHTFVDPAGATIVGKAECAAAWRGFFAAFPDYRNRFDAVSATGSSVTVDGRSECSEPALAGPARWSAVVRFDKVARWQVDAVPGPDPTHPA